MRRQGARAALVLVAVSVGLPAARGAPRRAADLDEVAFERVVRPMLQKAGCAGPTCHGSGLIGLRLNPAGHDDPRDLVEVRRQVQWGRPEASPLYVKAIGARHLGGQVVAPGTCQAALLAGWIRGDRWAAPCPTPAVLVPGADALPPALDGLLASCVDGACHGGRAAPRLLDPLRPGAARVNATALAPSSDRFLPSRSRLLARLLGGQGHPRAFASSADPAYRRLYAWIAGVPPVLGPAPSFAVFARDVQPILRRRGCTNAGCHGGAATDLVLLGSPESALDDYLRLVPRIAAGLFPAKPRNQLPHGGGRRLGDAEDDCAAAAIAGWIAGAPPGVCSPRPLPDGGRFAALVQPSLEALTCPRCHADERLGFRFVAQPDAADLARNYRAVLAKVDLDYPPVSPVLLRVHEDCMQARILAWIERRPDPGCAVELRHFKGRFPTPPRR